MGRIKMKAYKATAKGLICRGHKFKRNEVNICAEAKCVNCGWHCAEDPLDCLSYYPDFKNSEFYIVAAGGDIHEDGSDSKISCTEITFGERLTMERFVEESIFYHAKHPLRGNSRIKQNTGDACGGFAIVRGYEPMASGKRGDVLGFIELDKSGGVYALATVTVTHASEAWRMVYGELQLVVSDT